MMSRAKICGSGINAEFDHNNQAAAAVSCGGDIEGEFVGVIAANAETGGGLGLCEVAVYGVDAGKTLFVRWIASEG